MMHICLIFMMILNWINIPVLRTYNGFGAPHYNGFGALHLQWFWCSALKRFWRFAHGWGL
jgi:hypothetical protein